MIPYENWRIYGPYRNKKDQRDRIMAISPIGEKRTVSYPKYIMELHLGRYLDKDETIDHIDRNFHNNYISNLQILSKSKHSSIDAHRVKSQNFFCAYCSIEFSLSKKKLSDARRNRKQGKSGPYCSRRCAGIDSHNHKRKTCIVKDSEYYQLEK